MYDNLTVAQVINVAVGRCRLIRWWICLTTEIANRYNESQRRIGRLKADKLQSHQTQPGDRKLPSVTHGSKPARQFCNPIIRWHWQNRDWRFCDKLTFPNTEGRSPEGTYMRLFTLKRSIFRVSSIHQTEGSHIRPWSMGIYLGLHSSLFYMGSLVVLECM